VTQAFRFGTSALLRAGSAPLRRRTNPHALPLSARSSLVDIRSHENAARRDRTKRLILGIVGLLLALPCWVRAQDGRPKIYGISYVKVKVTDLGKAKAFYGGLLGLETSLDGCKGEPEPCFAVNPHQRVELIRTMEGDQGSFLAEIGFAASDVTQMLKYLTARGVIATEIVKRANGQEYFEVKDPEGMKVVFEGASRNDAEVQKSGQISSRLFHAGFVVNDLKAEKAFYQDVLGFRLYWKGGFKDGGLDWYEIQVPDGNNWVEFMLNIPPDADHKELGVQNHFSLGVESANVAATKLRAKGAKDFDGPEVGRDGKNALDIYDQDQTRVELMEFVPTGKPCCMEYAAPHPKP
jgi:catechol 2,3-dioxygenase-like lactoylglutathione lyase family enzyme